MSALPLFTYSDRGLAPDEAFETWRRLMGPMFSIGPAPGGSGLPRGGLTAFLLGDILAGRCFFNAQRLVRQPTLVDSTPDHLVLRMYLGGGFVGEFDGRPVAIARGRAAICDLRRPLDVEATSSDTIGLTVPRTLLHGIDVERLPPQLDAARERLLAARMTALCQQLPQLGAAEAHAATGDLLAALRRLFDPSAAIDVLDGREFDADLFTLVEQVISASLSSDMTPATLAERVRVSRATLYRVFAPVGGVMGHVFAMRLDAIRAALDQPLETRTLSRLAADHGFKSLAHLSRSFRSRYGVSPREWRERRAAEARSESPEDPRRVQGWWRELGASTERHTRSDADLRQR